MNLYFFYVFNHDDNPWKILILIMVRTKRERKKVEKGGKRWKERANKGRKKLEGTLCGPRFLCLVPFERVSSLGLPALGRPLNLEGTRCKTLLLYKYKSHRV